MAGSSSSKRFFGLSSAASSASSIALACTYTVDAANMTALVSYTAGSAGVIEAGALTAADLSGITALSGMTTVNAGAGALITVNDVVTAAITTYSADSGSGIIEAGADATVDISAITSLTNIVTVNAGAAATITVNDAVLAAITTFTADSTGGTLDVGSDTSINLTVADTLTNIAAVTSAGSTTYTVDAGIILGIRNGFTLDGPMVMKRVCCASISDNPPMPVPSMTPIRVGSRLTGRR